MKNETDFDILRSQLRPRLKQYLLEKGQSISENGMMSCINPVHSDNTASMKLLSDLNNEQLYCYGCSCKADIFTAHHWLDGAPINGPGFVRSNVYDLADRWSIPYVAAALTPEQLERIELERFVNTVSELLVATDERENAINWTKDHILKRQWNPDICKKLRISTIVNYDRFLKDIQRSTGLTSEQIKERGISSHIFGPDRITITLFDERGVPVGFTARWMDWAQGSPYPKYVNSPHSVLFRKKELLYGMNLMRPSGNRRLDLFEGVADFISAYGQGHNSCVALCGCSINEEQVALIQRLGFRRVNLVLDEDTTGQKQVNKYMEMLSGREGLRVSMSRLRPPVQGDPQPKDPDEFIIKYGLAEFFKLGSVDAFDYMIERDYQDVLQAKLDPVEWSSQIIPIIQNTENRIERGRQIAKLAEVTGVAETDIRGEIARLETTSVKKMRDDLLQGLQKARDTDEILSTIDKARVNIQTSGMDNDNRKRLTVSESAENFDNLVEVLSNKSVGMQGWKTHFSILDTRLSGIPKPVGLDADGNQIRIPGSLFGIAGAPQHAKSTIMQNIAWRVAQHNSDVTELYWALDDSRERTYERMLAQHSQVDWKKVTRRMSMTPAEQKRLDDSIAFFRELIHEGRLVLKDHSVGSTMPMLRRWIESTQDQYGRPILLCVDSFHKIHGSGPESGLTDFSRTKKHCEEFKSLAQTHHLTVLATLEVNKSATRGREPDTMSMTETRKLEYDFDILGMVFNHYYDMDGQSDLVLPGENGAVRPLIKFNIRKSKDGGSGAFYFALDTTNFTIQPLTMEEVHALTGAQEAKFTLDFKEDTKPKQCIPSASRGPYDLSDRNHPARRRLTEPWKS